MIISPRILPDEWAIGFWGRVLFLNGLDGVGAAPARQELGRRLARERGAERWGADCDLDVISAAARMPSDQMLRCHTLVPFFRAVSSAVDADWLDSQHRFRLRGSGIAASDRLEPGVLCPACVEEDRSFWGFAYWRRSHQIDGVVVCDKHGCPLRRGISSLVAQTFPDSAGIRPLTGDETCLANEATDSPLIRRYGEFCSELLNRPRPLARLRLLHVLAKRAALVGIGCDVGHTLADLARRRLPARWASGLMASGALNDVLTRFNTRPATSDYALAAVLLFESNDEAFGELERPLPPLASLSPSIRVSVEEHVRPLSWAMEELQPRRERLTSALQDLFHGRDFQACVRKAACSPMLLEQVIVNLFGMRRPSSLEGAASMPAAPFGGGVSATASPRIA